MKLFLWPLFCGLLGLPLSLQAVDACRSPQNAIWVQAAVHVLSLCEKGKAVRIYPVSLGWGGVGKRRAGDHKTPLGIYGVGSPRSSVKYGTFVPILYPTPEQDKMGYSGSAIGLHGPPREFLPLGKRGEWIDWTDGCVAVPTDSDMQEISAWAQRQAPVFIEIE